MLKLRLHCNIYSDFEQAAECADYLVSIVCKSTEEEIGYENSTVNNMLKDKPDKQAHYLLQAGIAYSMYADSNCCKLYHKRKSIR